MSSVIASPSEEADENKVENMDEAPQVKEIPKVDLTGDGKLVIGYIDWDMINQKYLFMIDGKKVLVTMNENSRKKLQGIMMNGARREQEIQKKADIMTDAVKERAMQELQKLQNDYQAAEQREMALLQEEEDKLNQNLFLNIQQVLDDYCAKNNIDYVYNYQKGGPFLYVNKSNDITVQVLTTLNERYQKEKGK